MNDPLKELQLNFNKQRQMHRLASSYLGARQFLFIFLPSIAITMISGISSFLSDNVIASSSEVHIGVPGNTLVLTLSNMVGILSIISIFLQSINKELDWSHRSKQHESLAVDLRALDDNLSFEILRYSASSTTSSVKEEEQVQVAEIVLKYQNQFDQAMKSCKSPLPPQIWNAFELIDSRIRFCCHNSGSAQKNETEIEIDWTSILIHVNNELYNQFCSSLFWPYIMPSGEHIVDQTTTKVFEIYFDEKIN